MAVARPCTKEKVIAPCARAVEKNQKGMTMNDREILDAILSGNNGIHISAYGPEGGCISIRSKDDLIDHLSDDPISQHRFNARLLDLSDKDYNWLMTARESEGQCIAKCKSGKRCRRPSREYYYLKKHEDLFCVIHDPDKTEWEFERKEFIPEEKTK